MSLHIAHFTKEDKFRDATLAYRHWHDKFFAKDWTESEKIGKKRWLEHKALDYRECVEDDRVGCTCVEDSLDYRQIRHYVEHFVKPTTSHLIIRDETGVKHDDAWLEQ